MLTHSRKAGTSFVSRYFSHAASFGTEKLYNVIKLESLKYSGALDPSNGGQYYLNNNVLYNRDGGHVVETLQHPRDQGAVLTGDSMMIEAARQNIQSLRAQGNSNLSWVSRDYFGDVSSSLRLKNSEGESIPLSNMSAREVKKILGDTGYDAYQKYCDILTDKVSERTR